ncbi:MAG: right-handed parallel beta-helix repeat-containing protein [Pirellulaceae bacterium]|nr:right-handed parallel beta-helix repeat-containing protein [Planctomycetales bacterium]
MLYGFCRGSRVAIVTTILVGTASPDVLAREWVVHRQHEAAADGNEGTKSAPLKTINAAAQRAEPGDIVLVFGGIYRERVAPARGGVSGRPIVYMAAPGERVVIRGSEQWHATWHQVPGSEEILRAKLDPGLFAGQTRNPFRTLLKCSPGGSRLTLGQLFVDGRPLREVSQWSALAANRATWMAEPGGESIVIHPPDGDVSLEQRLVEVAVRHRIFAPLRRGLGYIHVRGFIMEHCANQFPDHFWQSDSPQAGALGCRAGHHWLIEGNTVRYAKAIGIDCGYEGPVDLDGRQPTPRTTGFHLIANNIVSDNGCCGIAGMRSEQSVILGNVIERNNTNGHTAPEAAGIKMHHFVSGRIEGNLVRDNEAYGIWLDNTFTQAVISRNVIMNNRGSAVLIELGTGPLQIDNNVLCGTRATLDSSLDQADGLATLDASRIQFVHNLVFGCRRFGSFHRQATNRHRAACSDLVLRNNTFDDNDAGHVNLPYPGPTAIGNRVEGNLFGRPGKYLLNPWGGASASLLRSFMEKTPTEDFELNDRHMPRMSLAQWQQMTPGVSGNVEEVCAVAVAPQELVLTLSIPSDVELRSRMNAADAIPGVDLLGVEYAKQNAVIGPFQSLDHGRNILTLWPLPSRDLSPFK